MASGLRCSLPLLLPLLLLCPAARLAAPAAQGCPGRQQLLAAVRQMQQLLKGQETRFAEGLRLMKSRLSTLHAALVKAAPEPAPGLALREEYTCPSHRLQLLQENKASDRGKVFTKAQVDCISSSFPHPFPCPPDHFGFCVGGSRAQRFEGKRLTRTGCPLHPDLILVRFGGQRVSTS